LLSFLFESTLDLLGTAHSPFVDSSLSRVEIEAISATPT
jgi:hypothetical protein